MSSMAPENPRVEAASRWERLRRRFDDLETLRQRLDYQTWLLAAAGLVASLLLGLGDLATQGPIEQRQAEDMLATLAQVLPPDLYDNDLLRDVKTVADAGLGETRVSMARKNGEVTAVAFKLSATGGYSGPIALVMGLKADGTVLGVRVVAHAETPGLGDKIETAKSDWILSFSGRSLDNTSEEHWRVKKDGGDFDQFAGATITPRAVVGGVFKGLQFFRRHRAELVSPATGGQ
ncbi:electron transport complex subunit RsxG [Methylococcus geothermalis]|uniref:Ion-translocating oxidoreductase complex subunit G n=1 Tax=Methylococcus geothermalis TaxID=2681310 RepID=A0A858Q466_9GAMM|nr:electron transport complex subunit RsxG [Methylococcus geothermalis]QJD28627.1 electron transport complex subunit RsxG [Methylococcus geothermalis]